jgi:hypothetical protein
VVEQWAAATAHLAPAADQTEIAKVTSGALGSDGREQR